MPGIIGLLPLLDGWHYQHYAFEGDVAQDAFNPGNLLNISSLPKINPGQTLRLVEEPSARGWIISMTIGINGPYAKVGFAPKQTTPANIGLSVWDLINRGNTKPSNGPLFLGLGAMREVVFRGTNVAAVVSNTGIQLSDPSLVNAISPGGGGALSPFIPRTDLIVYPGYAVSLRAPKANIGQVTIFTFIRIFPAGSASYAVRGNSASIILVPGDAVLIEDVRHLNTLWAGFAGAGNGDSVEVLHEVCDIPSINLDPSTPLPFRNGFRIDIFNPDNIPAAASSGIPKSAAGDLNTVAALVPYYNITTAVVDDQKAFSASLKALGVSLG